MTLALKAEQFRSLHQDGCFTLPNAWDAGSARLLASLGFPAIATTSAGLAFMLGRRDGVAAVSRTDAVADAADIVAATDLPVSADLEDGYGPTPANDFGRHRSILHRSRRSITAVIGATTVITCVIRYEIDPYKVEAFDEYARRWGQVIPQCGARIRSNRR